MLRDASGHLVMTKGWRTFLILMAIVEEQDGIQL